MRNKETLKRWFWRAIQYGDTLTHIYQDLDAALVIATDFNSIELIKEILEHIKTDIKEVILEKDEEMS